MHEVGFTDSDHRYFNITNNQRYTSATQFIEKFHNKFEDVEDFWLVYKSVQYMSSVDRNKIKKYSIELDNEINRRIFSLTKYNQLIKYALSKCNYDVEMFLEIFSDEEKQELIRSAKIIKKYWIGENDTSKVKGTDFHNWKEGLQLHSREYQYYDNVFPVTHDPGYDLSKLQCGIYPELRIWNHKHRLAGTVDQPIFLPDRKLIIRDWKTNKQIVTANKYQKMLPPIEHLDDCNWVHYALQLSLYGWMLEQYGWELIHLEFEHFDIEIYDDEYIVTDSRIYTLPYMKREIENMIDYATVQGYI